MDVASILVFVAVGRRSHDEDGGLVSGVAEVAAPFLLALALGWLVARAWRAPRTIRTGLVVWPVTVVAGLLLRRVAFDRGTAASFVVVATLVTGALLVGWRAVALRLPGGSRTSRRAAG